MAKQIPSDISEEVKARFWAKVDVRGPDECWAWLGAKTTQGYGNFSNAFMSKLAHRVSYFLNAGEQPDCALSVCHSCDNPSCVNPAHLWLGTNAENVLDRDRKGRGWDRSGSRNAQSKLTESAAAAIKADGRKHRIIAADYGVSRTVVCSIKNRRSWAHLP